MTSGTPWSVKGIDPKAREVAKDLARRSGMTLGEWLNHMILEDDELPEEVTSEAHFAAAAPRPPRTYFETPRRPADAQAAPARYEAQEHPADEIGRVALAIERLTERLEASESRVGMAVSSVEHSVREAVSRIHAAEREHVAVAARFEGAVDEAVTETARLAERVRRIETEAAGPRSAEALRSLEQALGKVAAHLYEGESRTREIIAGVEARVREVEARPAGGGADPIELVDAVVNRVGERLAAVEGRTAEALEGLRDAFANLDGRLHVVEKGEGPLFGERLEQLAASLTSRVEASRAEIADKLRAATEGRFDRMEQKLAEMADHVRTAEQRSAQAVERMGREVLTMADTLNRRVQTAESRGADAIEQVGGEVARIAQAMEGRLSRTDSVHAEALEKLGGEIARITERLTERIGNAERRSAQAIDDVGEQVARVTERINHRAERTSEDLAERIRLSEERTARLLEEAREKIDQRLAEAQRRLAETVEVAAEPKKPARGEPMSPFGLDPFPSFGPAEPDPLARQAFAAPAAAAAYAPAAAFAAADAYAPAAFPAEAEAPDFAAEDFEAADGFAAIDDPESPVEEPHAPAFATHPALEPQALGGDPSRPLSTREVIEQARAAARAAATSGEGKKGKSRKEKPARAEGEGGGSLFTGLLRPRRRAGGSLNTALMIAGTAAALGVGSAGVLLLEGQPSGGPSERVAEALNLGRTTAEIAGPEADTTPFGPAPKAAVALIPEAVGDTAALPGPAAPGGQDVAQLYADAVRAVEAKQAGGLDNLRKAANLGHAPAQFYLGKLYENGEAGLKKDMVQARRWTERAAQAGDPRAMHNLALFYFAGNGGDKNSTLAAQWFRRAADQGLVDSQYNLGRLYEEGIGVSQNPAEAYKWYLIAGKQGDTESQTSALRVRGKLSAEAQVIAQRTAQGFRPASAAPSSGVVQAPAAPAGPPTAAVSTAQRALSRLGYYQGPTDGAASPALRLAVAAYQRDQGLASTGVLDQATISRLSVFTR